MGKPEVVVTSRGIYAFFRITKIIKGSNKIKEKEKWGSDHQAYGF